MASDKEQAYIESLQSFSKSFEAVVEAIKNQVESQKQAFADAIGNSKEEAKHLAEIAVQLQKVSEDITTTKDNTEQILQHVRGLRRQKETGFFSNLSFKNKQTGVADGIKSMVLMAGAIMAIGLAFKVVGDVDFKSVIALSIALPLVAMAFNKVAENSLSPKEALQVGMVTIIMGAAMSGAGFMLSFMPELSLMQLITTIGVAAAMGIAMYGLAEATQNLGRGKIKNLYAMVPILPFVAAGITGAGFILAEMPTITLEQFMSALGVGIAMGASMIPLALAASFMKGKATDVLMLAVLMPVVAGAILASAYILQDIPDIDTLGVIETSFAITAATTVMGTGLWALGKLGLSTKDIIMGTLGMVVISAGIMAISHILGLGDYTNYPPIEWAKGVGMSFLVSLPAVLILGALGATGIGFLVIAAGIAGMLMMAGALVAVGDILSTGNFTGGPSVEWARGVGISLIAFTSALGALSPGLFGWLMGDTFESNIANIVKIAEALNDVGEIVSKGTYTGGPSPEWAKGVGMSMMYFAEALSAFKPGVWGFLMGDTFDGNIAGLKKLAALMPMLPKILGPSSIYEGTGPKKQWAEGVGMSMKYFAQALESFKPGVWDFLTGTTFDDNIAGVKKLARLMPQLPALLGPSGIYEGTGPDKKWAEGVGAALVAIGTTVATLADEVDPEDVYAWITPIRHLSSLIPYFAMKMNGMKFDSYPSKRWSEGILEFLNGFAEYEGSDGDVQETAKNVRVLAGSYFKLAKAIMALGSALNKIKNVPDLTNLYGGLVTLSLIDNDNLSVVMDNIHSRDSEFAAVINKLKSNTGNVTAPSNKSFSDGIPKGKGGKVTVANTQTKGVVNKPAVQRVNPVYRTNDLLAKHYFILKNIEKAINEVADNTTVGRSSHIG